MKKNNYTIVISGGHLTPALALIDYLLTKQPQVNIHMIGRLYSQSGKSQRSREQAEIKQRQLPFYHLAAPKFANRAWWQKIISLPQLGASIFKAWWLLNKIQPDVFISFGGYLAVPIAVAAKLKQIPIITHEQTHTLGLANRQISKLAQKVAVSHPSTLNLLPKNLGVLTGNPLRSELFTMQPRPDWLAQPNLPLIYVTGGRLGSEVINTTIGQCLPQLLKKYIIIHQTGSSTVRRNYRQEMEQVVKNLPPRLQKRYYIREWVTATELAWILQSASLVISRAGANTTQELKTLKVQSVLIPLPFAFDNEQYKNAQELVNLKLAQIVEQKDLAATDLIKIINQSISNHYKNSINDYQKSKLGSVDQNLAAKKIWQLIEQVVINK